MSLLSPKELTAINTLHAKAMKDVRLMDAERIKMFGTETGSRVFGGCTKESDYDYVMTSSEVISSLQYPWLNELSTYASLFHSVKTNDVYGKEINLIIVEDEVSLEAWKYATDSMLLIPDTCDKITKEQRNQIFGYMLLAHYKRYGSEEQIELAEEMWG